MRERGGLVVWVYGISTFEGYLMPNPFIYKWIVLFQTIQFNIRTEFVKNIYISRYSVHSNSYNSNNSVYYTYSFFHSQRSVRTVLFQTIQLSIKKQFYFINTLFSSFSHIGLYHVLPFRIRMDLGVIKMKGILLILQSWRILKPRHHIV